MELIFNDFSLDGQFSTIEEFETYAAKVFLPLLDTIIDKKVPFYKKTDTYQRKLTKDETLLEYLHRSNRTAASIIKRRMYQIAYAEPYWDDGNEKTRPESSYEYPGSAEKPNCFTEAIERQCHLVSFSHQNYKEEAILCMRDKKAAKLCNIMKKEMFLTEYLRENPGLVKDVIEKYPFAKGVKLGMVSDKCYAEEALMNNGLEVQDLLKILHNISNLIEDKKHGTKSHWWDSVVDDICEYRISVSSNREFRLFFLWREQLIFLSGYIKKTEKIPLSEKRKVREIASRI